MTPFAVAVLVDGVADLSVLHQPADLFTEPPLRATARCGATGYVYLRAGLPKSAAVCVDCARPAAPCVPGSIVRYNKGCRCDSCRAAAARYRRDLRARNAALCSECGQPCSRPGATRCWECFRRRGSQTVCGTVSGYARGCRCDLCVAARRVAHRVYMAEYRARRVA